MSKGMLGNVSLLDTQGPMNDLQVKLSGDRGPEWLVALKRFLRKEIDQDARSLQYQVTLRGRSGDRLFLRNQEMSFVPMKGTKLHLDDLEFEVDSVEWVQNVDRPQIEIVHSYDERILGYFEENEYWKSV